MTAGETAALYAWTNLASDPEAAGILIDAWSVQEFERDHLQIFLGHDPGFTGEGRSALDATGQAT